MSGSRPQSRRASRVCWPVAAGGRRQGARGPGEPRRRRGLGHPLHRGVRRPRGQVRVLRRPVQRDHGRDARVEVGEHLDPLGLGAPGERRRQPGPQPRPQARVRPVRARPPARAPGPAAAPRRTSAPGRRRPRARRRRWRRRRRTARPVSSRLTPRLGSHTPAASRPCSWAVSSAVPSTIAASTTCPRPLACRSCSAARMPTRQSIAPPPKSPSRFGGDLRRAAGAAGGVQGAGHRDVGDVVPGGPGERAVLAPAGHPGVDQPRG